MDEINIDIASAGFMGYLFKPETSIDKAIIVLTGSDGGIENAKAIAKIFSKNGYIALAVGYWKMKGLSKTISHIPVEYIENSIKWLKKQNSRVTQKIAVYGWSKGAELALVAASYFSDISCVIAVTPSCYVYEGIGWGKFPSGTSSWTYKGQSLPFISMKGCAGLKFLKRIWNEKHIKIAFRYEEALSRKLPSNAEICVEKIKGDILLLSVSNDEIWLSKMASESIINKLYKSKFKYRFKHINFERGSHFLIPITTKNTKILSTERKYPSECMEARRMALNYTLDWLKEW